MILVDTSVWVDLLNKGDRALEELLDRQEVFMHPLVIGELAMGILNPRRAILHMLANLPQIDIASDRETLDLVSAHRLFGLGLGYIDAHLLASARLTAGALLWTRDKRMERVAESLHIAYRPR